jgi:hypothetical protein
MRVWHARCSSNYMSAAPLRSVMDADFEEIGDQRRADRRQSDRRAQRARLDVGFAATLINQIAPPERPSARYETAPRRIRAGLAFDLKA